MSKDAGSMVQGPGKKILIVRLDRIGDVLLSTPVIKNVRDAYPDSYIAFMVRPCARQIVEGNPFLNEVILYDKKESLNLILGLRRKQFDIAIVLHPTSRTHIILALAGIPERIGYDRKMGFLLTKRIPHAKQFGLKHEIDYTLDILRYIGIDPKDRTLYMPRTDESARKIAKIFSEAGIRDGGFSIAVNPGASCASKRWPVVNFARAADGLAKRYNAKIVIISAKEDKIWADEVASLMSAPAVNLAGRTDIADVAEVLRKVKLFVSNDSGPVHIACAVGAPVIAVFGRSDRGLSPERWGPTGSRDAALHKDVGCDECLAHNCGRGFKCLEAITVEDVLAAASKILGS